MNDGPQGFRDNANPGTSTAWPSAMTVGATWDTDLVYKWGEAMGKVCPLTRQCASFRILPLALTSECQFRFPS